MRGIHWMREGGATTTTVVDVPQIVLRRQMLRERLRGGRRGRGPGVDKRDTALGRTDGDPGQET